MVARRSSRTETLGEIGAEPEPIVDDDAAQVLDPALELFDPFLDAAVTVRLDHYPASLKLGHFRLGKVGVAAGPVEGRLLPADHPVRTAQTGGRLLRRSSIWELGNDPRRRRASLAPAGSQAQQEGNTAHEDPPPMPAEARDGSHAVRCFPRCGYVKSDAGGWGGEGRQSQDARGGETGSSCQRGLSGCAASAP